METRVFGWNHRSTAVDVHLALLHRLCYRLHFHSVAAQAWWMIQACLVSDEASQARYRRSSSLSPVSCPERLHQTFFQPVTSLDQTFSSLSPTRRHSAPFLVSDAPLLTHTPTQPQTLPRETLVVEVEARTPFLSPCRINTKSKHQYKK